MKAGTKEFSLDPDTLAQAAMLQKLKSQVGSDKMFSLMMDLLKPEAGKSGDLAATESGSGQIKSEATTSYSRDTSGRQSDGHHHHQQQQSSSSYYPSQPQTITSSGPKQEPRPPAPAQPYLQQPAVAYPPPPPPPQQQQQQLYTSYPVQQPYHHNINPSYGSLYAPQPPYPPLPPSTHYQGGSSMMPASYQGQQQQQQQQQYYPPQQGGYQYPR